jgi:hypothetical protein
MFAHADDLASLPPPQPLFVSPPFPGATPPTGSRRGQSPPPLPTSANDDRRVGVSPPPLPDATRHAGKDATAALIGVREQSGAHVGSLPSSGWASVESPSGGYAGDGKRQASDQQGSSVHDRQPSHGSDPWAAVGRRYASPCVSFVVHVIVLLVLAFWVTSDDRPRPLALVIDTSAADTVLEVEDLPVELPTDEPEVDLPDALEFPEMSADVMDEADVSVAAFAFADPLPADLTADVAGVDLLGHVEGAPSPVAPPGEVQDVGRGGPVGEGNGLGAGFGGEVGRRLWMAGAQTGDVQVSLAWNNMNDIDLHVVSPRGERIFFGHRRSWCGGCLDVDMNVYPVNPRAVENVFWPHGSAPPGVYTVFVHLYRRHVHENATPFEVHVLVKNHKEVFRGVVQYGRGPILVAQFDLDGRGLPGAMREDMVDSRPGSSD